MRNDLDMGSGRTPLASPFSRGPRSISELLAPDLLGGLFPQHDQEEAGKSGKPGKAAPAFLKKGKSGSAGPIEGKRAEKKVARPSVEEAAAAQAGLFEDEAKAKKMRERIDEALEVEREDAQKAGALAYSSRVLAQISIPYQDPGNQIRYTKTNGTISLTIMATSPKWGIPYGLVPRRLLLYISTQAVQTQEPEIFLCNHQADFMRALGFKQDGRSIASVHEQSQRLFHSLISIEHTRRSENWTEETSERLLLTSRSFSLWEGGPAGGVKRWASKITLSEEFFKHICSAPVPLDGRIVQALGRKVFSLDVYTWLSYRLFVLTRSGKSKLSIPWDALMRQFVPAWETGEDAAARLVVFRARMQKAIVELGQYNGAIMKGVAPESFARSSPSLTLVPTKLLVPARRQSTKGRGAATH